MCGKKKVQKKTTFRYAKFGTSGEDLRKAMADMIKRLCQDNTVKHL